MPKPRPAAKPTEVAGDIPAPPAAPMIGPRLDDLAARLAFHREQETFHSQRVAFHEAERARHQKAVYELASGEASPPEAAVAAPAAPPAAAPSRPWFEPPAPGRRLRITYWVARLVEEYAADQSFTASGLTETLNQLCAPHLSKPLGSRALALGRLAQSGQLRVLQPGTSHREAVYGWPVR
jgi:hypothetical protein